MKCEICDKTVYFWQTPKLSMGTFTFCHKKCWEVYMALKRRFKLKIIKDGRELKHHCKICKVYFPLEDELSKRMGVGLPDEYICSECMERMSE